MSEGYDFEAAEPSYGKYRVYLSSVPGHWERYDGYVDVFAPDDVDDLSGEVFARAVRALAKSSFPDRPSLSSWRMERFERL